MLFYLLSACSFLDWYLKYTHWLAKCDAGLYSECLWGNSLVKDTTDGCIMVQTETIHLILDPALYP